MTLDSRTATTADVSNYFVETALWPAVLYTVMLMITGTIGNILVLLVYRRHFRRSVTRMFIFALAAFDLGSCLITMPSELVILLRFVSFPSAWWCKASRYISYALNGSSSLILIVIAMDRYYKVCRPYTACITIPIAKKICLASISLTAVLSIPSLFLYNNVNFPLLVKDGRARILPPDLENATWMPEGWYIEQGVIKSGAKMLTPNRRGTDGEPDGSFTFLDPASPFSASVAPGENYQAHPNGESTDNNQAQAAPVGILFGDFCLISSEDSESPLALFFYGYMFFLYVLLLILVIYFYSRVAHAMFLLRNIHANMFNLAGKSGDEDYKGPSRRSVTPRTASLAQELDGYDVQFHQNGGRAVGELSQEAVVLLSHGVLKDRENQDGRHNFEADSKIETKEERSVTKENKLVIAPKEDDLEHSAYEAEGWSQNMSRNSMSSASSKNQQVTDHSENSGNQSLNVSSNLVCATRILETSSCSNMPHIHEDAPEQGNNTLGSPRSKSAEDILQEDNKIPDRDVRDQSSRKSKKGSFKKKSGKAPKIKVSQTNEAVLDDQKFSQHPASTNSLLLRRIRSMENVNQLPKLDCLQVPGKRKHSPIIPKESLESQKSDLRKKQRETAEGIGKLTNSSTSLQYTSSAAGHEEEGDGAEFAEKTLTLTRSSAKGKRNVCVLPLTGLTTKAALQNQAREEEKQREAKLKSSTLPASLLHASLLAATRGGKLSERRGSGMDTLENPAFEDSVKLRPKSMLSSRSSIRKTIEFEDMLGKPSAESKDTDRNGYAETNGQRPRPSTADILSERHRRGSIHPGRTSRMLFVISLAFLVSFLPFFIVVLTRSAIGSSSFLASLSGAELGAVSIFVRSSLISNAVNPVIYGLLSTHFRRECTGLVCCILGR